MNQIRKNKWKKYQEICEGISPYPVWFYEDEDKSFTANDLVEGYNVTEEEAERIINRLLKDRKLEETEDEGRYIPVRVCDICGCKFDDFDLQENHHHSYHFGYPSKFDLMDIEFDVCTECFDKMIDAILPLFPESPLKDGEIYQEDGDKTPYITTVEEHDEDPF